MNDVDRLFFLIALLNTGIGLSNVEKNENQENDQKETHELLEAIYDKVLNIERELGIKDGNE